MGHSRANTGAPRSHKGWLWSKIIDAMVGSGAADGDLLLRSSGVWARKAIGTNGQYFKMVSGVPDWATLSGGGGVEFFDSAYQASDLVITNATTGTTFTNTDLVVTLPTGRYRYMFQSFGITNATPVMKQRLHFTGTASLSKYEAVLILETDTRHFNAFEEAFEINHPWTGFTGNVCTTYQGAVIVTGTGDLSYQVAQTTASATSITHHRGSSAIVWQIN